MGKKLSYEYVKEYIEKENYCLVSEKYINANTPLITICPKGHIHRTTFGNFTRGQRCKKCVNKNVKYTIKDVKDFVERERYYLLSEEYINCKEKIDMLCPKGHFYQSSFDNFKRGKRCSHCRLKSKGEEKIVEILSKFNINFIRQYTFSDCKYINVIPFDFYLPHANLIIEYDGIQHFEEIKNWGGVEKLKRTQEKDMIKNEYCKNNNIKLIRIPYWDFNNIEEILMKEFNLK